VVVGADHPLALALITAILVRKRKNEEINFNILRKREIPA
jgi:hypothetical protein